MKKLLASLYTYALLAPAFAYGVTPGQIGESACKANPGAVGCGSGSKIFGPGSIFENAIEVVIGITASISVLMVVVGGLRYVLSGGDSAGIRSAKDTILYALVGLVVSIFAFAIVRYIIGAVR